MTAVTAKKVQKIWRCSKCHSSDVRADAFAAWAVDTQKWELDSIFTEKGAWCERCDGMSKLQCVPVSEHTEPESEEDADA